jgi:hypothetical protein
MPQKIKALLAIVYEPGLAWMKRQASSFNVTLHLLKCGCSFFLTTAQDYDVFSVTYHLIAELGHPMVQST